MGKKDLINSIIAMVMSVAVLAVNIVGDNPKALAKPVVKEKEQNYIVQAVSGSSLSEIEQKFEGADTVNANGEDLLEENNMVSFRLTASEAKELEKENIVKSVEEDSMVSASSVTKVPHQKKVKVYKQNKKDSEWNMQMIHADKKKKKCKNKVKVAVLDSGVDYGNDIELAYSVSLVPKEEGMNPLFMDGTGHGNSVAGLIAASDNDEGITGVNPNAEIYSIRVLDDNNQAPISRIIEGIYMAIENKVNIINMSFGISEYSEAMHQAVKDASEAGILLIAAAGNTGEKGVQYPAAYDEVMAVGSVNQNGDIAEDSAVGKQVEIVAPGELVRSTGEFGDEIVASGTSLAAPQVTGVASLLWEKDLYVSSESIRDMLNYSANLYGEESQYGNGLLDGEEAFDIYHDVKKLRTNIDMTDVTSDNKKAITTFKDTGCVEGSWSKKDHQGMIPSAYSNVKKGARYPDTESDLLLDGKEINGKKLYVFAGMCHNPWWHGYYQKAEVKNKAGNYEGKYFNNYVASYIYLTRLANEFKKGGVASVPNGVTATIKNEIKNDVGKIDWVRLYGYVPSSGTKRAFVWGMALHSLADSFAHSTWTKKYGVITHAPDEDTDNVTVVAQRWKHAKKAVDSAISKYKSGESVSGTFSDYSIVKSATDYKMVNIYKYMKEVAGEKAAGAYSNKSHSVNLSK